MEILSPIEINKKLHASIDESLLDELAVNKKKTKLFELCYVILGILPPVNNIGYHEQNDEIDTWKGIESPDFIFRGLKRRFKSANADSSVYIYTLSPKFKYEYVPSMVCPAKRIKLPEHRIFVVYIILERENAVILWWDLVEECKEHKGKPINSDERYEEEIHNFRG